MTARAILAALAVICAILIAVILGAVELKERYQDMASARFAAERRATTAEAQLAEILRAGDCGLLLARIPQRPHGTFLVAQIVTDFGPAEVRIRPMPYQGGKK